MRLNRLRSAVLKTVLTAGLAVVALSDRGYAGDSVPVSVAVPPTPSSVPIILAGSRTAGIRVTVFNSHTQAHTLFLRRDVDVLVTGLSIGRRFYEGGVPIRIISSYISGMTYLVALEEGLDRFAGLKGQTLAVPFPGSPIEDVTAFFIRREGLDWPGDFNVVYMPLEATLEQLKVGRIRAAVLPEPMAAIAVLTVGARSVLKYKDHWDALTDTGQGYPQVGVYAFADWIERHPERVARLNHAVAEAIDRITTDRPGVLETVRPFLGLTTDILDLSLDRTDFRLITDDALKASVTFYYRTIGQPLDETHHAFFYHAAP